MQLQRLKRLIVDTLEELKAREVLVLDVRGKTAITDLMVIASGTSDRHVKALAEAVAYAAKQKGQTVLGMEGVREGEWALIDLGDAVVHVMLPRMRAFYQLERLWGFDEGARVAEAEV